MSEPRKPKAKFKKGQVVMVVIGKKSLPFKIQKVIWQDESWFYQWNSNNAAAEHMIRPLDDKEAGR